MKRSRIISISVFLVIAVFLLLNMGPTSDKCVWCNGVGWVGNGAKNATEFALKKTICPYCHGTGKIK